jgi:cation diffusion facilitator CzcD-associated flavoprotein CzcO
MPVATGDAVETVSSGKPGKFDYPPPSYRVLDQYHSKSSKIRVAGAGAGATGICLAYKLERMLEPGSFELILFEKNQHFGGTWWENTYPGVACDIPAPMYTYSFDPNPNWSQYFASGSEIQKYFENFAKRHGTNDAQCKSRTCS